MATDTRVGAGELFRTMIVQRPPCCASRIGKTVVQVYSCRLTRQEALSCVDARSQNSVPYEVLAFTDATAFGEVVTTTTLNPDFDGSLAMIENRFVEGPAGEAYNARPRDFSGWIRLRGRASRLGTVRRSSGIS